MTRTVTALNHTLFCQKRFLEAISKSGSEDGEPLPINAPDGTPLLYAMASKRRFGRRSVALSPYGLYAAPDGKWPIERSAKWIVDQLKSLGTINFSWNVRYDHQQLADSLMDLTLDYTTVTTHVLALTKSYPELFANFSSTTRNQVRRAERLGVHVRRAQSAAEVERYYSIYQQLASERGDWGSLYSMQLFAELFHLKSDASLLLAYVDEEAVAGAWFLRDGDSLLYWQSAMDYRFSKYFPIYAILSTAIRNACEAGIESVNLGGSLKKPQLEQFKSFWGADQRKCWRFHWQNPIWRILAGANRVLHYA